jgi:hypothetical protein
MSSLPFAVQRYIDKQTLPKPWALAGESRCDFLGAVVIPSLAEGDSLFSTLKSLASNPPQWIERFLVVVVVNHGEQVATEDCLQNQADLVRLAGLAENSPLSLAWVDAASHGLELPAKLAGVGFSRKLGLDLRCYPSAIRRRLTQRSRRQSSDMSSSCAATLLAYIWPVLLMRSILLAAP